MYPSSYNVLEPEISSSSGSLKGFTPAFKLTGKGSEMPKMFKGELGFLKDCKLPIADRMVNSANGHFRTLYIEYYTPSSRPRQSRGGRK